MTFLEWPIFGPENLVPNPNLGSGFEFCANCVIPLLILSWSAQPSFRGQKVYYTANTTSLTTLMY